MQLLADFQALYSGRLLLTHCGHSSFANSLRKITTMQLPLTNALNRFSRKRPVLSWVAYYVVLLAMFLLLSLDEIRASEKSFHEFGEIAAASTVLATVFYICIRIFGSE